MEVHRSYTYSFPNYECYYALKDHILQNLNFTYWFGYIPLGKMDVKVVEEHEPAYLLKGKLRMRAYNLIPYTYGPEINFYCKDVGNDLCNLEIVTTGSVYGNYLLNLTTDIIKELYPKFIRKRLPNIYLDSKVVYDKKTYISDRYRDDANFRLFIEVFERTNERLNEYLENRFK